MNAEPRELTWRGARRWACPFCRYDSPLYSDVAVHIGQKHANESADILIEPELSKMPVPVLPGEYPLISCVMPTRDRPTFVAQSIRYFSAQTYPNKELVIVATGYDLCNVVNDSGVPLKLVTLPVPEPQATVGHKRNIGAGHSSGEFIAHWDDDEWQSPNRLYEQFKAMRADVQLCGIGQPIFMDAETAELYWFSGPRPHRGYVSGSSMMYRRTLWERLKFPAVNIGEDTMFLQEVDARAVAHVSPGLNVSFVHSGNTVTKRVKESPYVLLRQRL